MAYKTHEKTSNTTNNEIPFFGFLTGRTMTISRVDDQHMQVYEDNLVVFIKI